MQDLNPKGMDAANDGTDSDNLAWRKRFGVLGLGRGRGALGPAAPLFSVGALLFLTSEMMLAFDMFVLKTDPRRIWG